MQGPGGASGRSSRLRRRRPRRRAPVRARARVALRGRGRRAARQARLVYQRDGQRGAAQQPRLQLGLAQAAPLHRDAGARRLLRQPRAGR